MPKFRAGSFYPSLLGRRCRIDQGAARGDHWAYVQGAFARSVDDLDASLGAGSGVSKSEVSRICAGLGREVEAFHARHLTRTTFLYAFCYATVCNVRIGAQVVSQGLVETTGAAAAYRAATRPRCPWLSCAKSSRPNRPAPDPHAEQARSPSLQHDSLITREPTPIRSAQAHGLSDGRPGRAELISAVSARGVDAVAVGATETQHVYLVALVIAAVGVRR